MSTSSSNDDDLVTLMFMLVGGFAMGGASFAGVLFAPIRHWMLDNHVLASGADVVIPFAEDFGLGWMQILVLGGLLAALIAITITWRRRRDQPR